VVITDEPLLPIHLPKRPPKIEPNRGKKIIDKENILNFINILLKNMKIIRKFYYL
jgi:hypothetical protein